MGYFAAADVCGVDDLGDTCRDGTDAGRSGDVERHDVGSCAVGELMPMVHVTTLAAVQQPGPPVA